MAGHPAPERATVSRGGSADACQTLPGRAGLPFHSINREEAHFLQQRSGLGSSLLNTQKSTFRRWKEGEPRIAVARFQPDPNKDPSGSNPSAFYGALYFNLASIMIQ